MVLGINIDNDSPERIKKFVAAENLEYRMLLRGDRVGFRDYHCRAFPTLYWIDREGTIVARDYGLLSPSTLEERATTILRR